MTSLADTYRPQSWADVVGQDAAIKQIETLRRRGLSGRAYWITGASGTGKTSIARLIAAEVADAWQTVEIDGSEVTADVLREVDSWRRRRPLGRGAALIVNEAHGLRRPAIRRLLTILDPLPAWLTIIFTTTNAGHDRLFDDEPESGPFLSRCQVISLARRGLAEPFARRAQQIARIEGLDGAPASAYLRLVRECRNNLRAALQRIEGGAMVSGEKE